MNERSGHFPISPLIWLLLAAGLVSGTATGQTGQSKRPAPIFMRAIEQIRSRTQIPILLPSKLPPTIKKYIKLATGEVSDNGYFVSIYFTEMEPGVGGDWAGGFAGSTEAIDHLPNTRAVQLAGGRTAIFRPISCGGSCAPANLWWEQNGFTYQIQIRLRSDTPERDQEKILLETANSMVLAHGPIRTH
jgi:hypothetical protein